MSPITKGENKGTVRLDLFFKKGEAHFIPTLFAYVMNNILGDRFKKAVPDSLDRELEGEDGRVIKQVANKPVYSATLVKYADLICTRPCGQAMLSGITES